MHTATAGEHISVIELLLKAEADVNIRDKNVNRYLYLGIFELTVYLR
jgi:hypothetical protein